MLLRTYVQRLRMEATLDGEWPLDVPSGYQLVEWEPGQEHAHAEVKHRAYHQTLDARLFANLRELNGCLELMRAVAALPQFQPEATWLVLGPDGPCGCVQATASSPKVGWIQNLGVVPEHRGHGLGRLLLRCALNGLRANGKRIAQLEVSARNTGAVNLYRAHGLVTKKSLYREVREEMLEYCV